MNRVVFSLCAGAAGCVLALQFPSLAIAKGPETVLYRFNGSPDGKAPSSMIDVKGTLYGTTSFGGTSTHCDSNGCGTVFALDPGTGAETVLYSFCAKFGKKELCTDSDVPGGMIAMEGKLYGESELGGAYQAGTVFSFDPKSLKEKVVHSFCAQNCTDGSYPDGGLTAVDGILYGTTPFGGDYDKGTIFALDPKTGTETVLYSFCSGGDPCTDGNLPSGGLIDVGGMLYGATGRGGANCQSNDACGTLYSFNLTTGVETTLYSFCGQPNCADGNEPANNLADMGGTLYGATVQGGAYHNAGTVFTFDPNTGAETVVYSFCQIMKGGICKDGAGPGGGLIAVNGKLYGTTGAGGKALVICASGCGAAFEIDPSTGQEEVLYAFCSQKLCKDGKIPRGLFDVNGTLYGTAAEGGTFGRHCYFGCGTVFALTR